MKRWAWWAALALIVPLAATLVRQRRQGRVYSFASPRYPNSGAWRE